MSLMYERLHEACVKQYECMKHKGLAYLALGVTEPKH